MCASKFYRNLCQKLPQAKLAYYLVQKITAGKNNKVFKKLT